MKILVLKKMLATIALCTSLSPALAQTATPQMCDNKPVYMVVNGLTLDRTRMITYGKAIQDSGLYASLHGYYINTARPIAVFEGNVPVNYATLIVRFPCLAHAHSFWYSKTYQEKILPLRQNPSAGDYTVTVYAEVDLPAYMKGKVRPPVYKKKFSSEAVSAIARVEGK
jgi:uncharacterized protein (DUF1330 family)